MGTMLLHDLLRLQAANLHEDVTLGWLAEQQQSAMPGLVVVLMALPSVLPLPGIGNVTGTALCAWALVMWLNKAQAGLPQRLAGLRLAPNHARRVLHLLAWLHEWACRLMRPRWLLLTTPRAWAWMAWPVATMGIVIFLPIPLGNIMGTAVLVVLGLGQTLRDGLAVVLSLVLGLLTLAYTVALTWGITALWSWL